MPLELPNLDDRTYDDLVEEALRLIPTYAPEWTNYNPSDPGITLIELFAYLTEMLLYRLNRVTNANQQVFLNLMSGLDENGQRKYPQPLDENTLHEELRKVILTIRQSDRAVTPQDFEQLALAANAQVARARCVPRRNLQTENPLAPPVDKPGHVSVVIVPKYLKSTETMFLFDGVDYHDYTEAIYSVAGGEFALNSQTDQFLYIGSTATFKGIQFRLDREQKREGYSLQFEYFDNNSHWSLLTSDNDQLSDGTNNWSSSGLVKFNPPANWSQTSINQVSAYWIRVATVTIPEQVAQASQFYPQPLTEIVRDYLEPRRLLTTQIHVVEPRYLPLGFRLKIVLKRDALVEEMETQIIDTLTDFFAPIKGGENQQGYPFGRDIYVSEVYEILERVPGIDYIEKADSQDELIVRDPNLFPDRIMKLNGSMYGVRLGANELVETQISQKDIEIISPVN